MANTEDRSVVSSRGFNTGRRIVFLRNDPVDIALDGGTLYILTRPSAGDPGRIYAVTGF